MSDENTQTTGVQHLIDRLRDEGVTKGEQEAEQLLENAKAKAREIVARAHEQADEFMAEARREADRLQSSGEEAIRLAIRDAVLKMGETLRDDFAHKLKKMVTYSLNDTEFLKQLLLEIGRRCVSGEEKPLNVLVPIEQYNPEDVDREGTLANFVANISADILREGIHYAPAAENAAGIRVQIVGDDVEVDLTDETVTQLLMAHLMPRFREIVGEQ